MATTVEQVETALAKVEGAMDAAFARLEGKIDGLTTAMTTMAATRSEDVSRLERVDSDHERRLRFLERAIWIAAGAGVVGGAGGSWLLGG